MQYSHTPLQMHAQPGLQVNWQQTEANSWLLRIQADHDWRGRISLRLPINHHCDPWWLLPGLLYGHGCHPTSVPVLRWARQAKEWQQPTWQVASDRLAYPLVAVHCDQQHWLGIHADPHYRLFEASGQEVIAGTSHWGDIEPQVGFEIHADEHDAHLAVNIPANEGPRRHTRSPQNQATARELFLSAGMVLELPLQVWSATGPRRLVHDWLRRSHALVAPQQAAPTPVKLEQIQEVATYGLLNWHWVEDPGYMAFTVAYDRSQEFNANMRGTSLGWHFEASGFVGAMQIAFALLWQANHGGDAKGTEVAKKLLHRWCTDGLAGNGLMRGSWHPGATKTINGTYANPAPIGSQNKDPSGNTPFYGSCWMGDQDVLHARNAADAMLYLARALQQLDTTDTLYPLMLGVLSQACTTALALQRADGCWGHLYNLKNNTVIDRRGEAGMWWIPALGESYDLFGDDSSMQDRLLAAMRRAGHYYARVHEQRCSVGAPEDTGMAATSEGPHAGIMGYRHLHRLDPDGEWLDAWQASADWLLSFQKVFNQRLGQHSMLSVYGLKTIGAQYASTQNNAIHCWGQQCTGDMIRLSEACGDPYYATRAMENIRYCWQTLSLEAGHWGGQKGMCTEQFYITDWSIFDHWDPGVQHEQKGTLMGSSHSWCITFMLLGLEQLYSVGDYAGIPSCQQPTVTDDIQYLSESPV